MNAVDKWLRTRNCGLMFENLRETIKILWNIVIKIGAASTVFMYLGNLSIWVITAPKLMVFFNSFLKSKHSMITELVFNEPMLTFTFQN